MRLVDTDNLTHLKTANTRQTEYEVRDNETKKKDSEKAEEVSGSYQVRAPPAPV